MIDNGRLRKPAKGHRMARAPGDTWSNCSGPSRHFWICRSNSEPVLPGWSRSLPVEKEREFIETGYLRRWFN